MQWQSKTSSLTVRGGPYIGDTSRISYFLGNRLKNGSKVDSIKRRLRFTTRKHPSNTLRQRLSQSNNRGAAGRIGKTPKFIGIRTSDLTQIMRVGYRFPLQTDAIFHP
jgi:hypothetical protein